jgi:uncharacterized membrane protein
MAKLRGRIAFLGGMAVGASIMRSLEAGRRGRLHGGGLRHSEPFWPDEVVTARVRAAVARAASHPHAIAVSVDHGDVTLRGPVLAHEMRAVLRRVARVAGVRAIGNELEPHAQSSDDARLSRRGKSENPPLEREVWPTNWRLAAAAAGVVLGRTGLAVARYRRLGGLALAASGAGLVVRAATNRSIVRMIGIDRARHVVDLRKTILVRAPVSEVFRFWAQVENFPLFMEHVLEVAVSPGDGRRSHWQVRGPAGLPVRWDAEVTRLVPDALFAWKTLPGSQLEHAGAVHFEELGPELTWLQVRMVYVPPAGALGHFLASVLSGDPETRVEEDLARLKSLLEDLHTLAPRGQASAIAADPDQPVVG